MKTEEYKEQLIKDILAWDTEKLFGIGILKDLEICSLELIHDNWQKLRMSERTMILYKDLISAVVKFTANGRKWYYQKLSNWDGNLEAVNLYDEDGNFVAEFPSISELKFFVNGVGE